MKILRDQHATLQGAVAVATNEQNLRPCVQMSHHSGYTSTQHMQHTRHTTMEVDHSSGQRFKNRTRFNKVNSSTQVRCWRCGQTGHISRDCKAEDIRRQPMDHGRPRPTNNQRNQENKGALRSLRSVRKVVKTT